MIDPMKDPRVAGQIYRYHTWPVIRQQSIAEHTWQVMRILVTIWPAAPQRLIRYVITHDLGEMTTGDAPYPIKRDNPILKKEMDRLENKALIEMAVEWNMPGAGECSPFELAVFKLAEFIEMWEYGLQEMNLGNKYAELIVERCVNGTGASRDRVNSFRVIDGDLIIKRAGEYIHKRSEQENVD